MGVQFIVKPSRGVSEEYNLQVCYPEIAKQWSDRNEISSEKCAPKTDKSAWRGGKTHIMYHTV